MTNGGTMRPIYGESPRIDVDVRKDGEIKEYCTVVLKRFLDYSLKLLLKWSLFCTPFVQFRFVSLLPV